MQCILGNFQYGGNQNMWNVHIFFLKEYEIITLIYNRKNMEVRFIIFAFLQYKLALRSWSTNMPKYELVNSIS